MLRTSFWKDPSALLLGIERKGREKPISSKRGKMGQVGQEGLAGCAEEHRHDPSERPCLEARSR